MIDLKDCVIGSYVTKDHVGWHYPNLEHWPDKIGMIIGVKQNYATMYDIIWVLWNFDSKVHTEFPKWMKLVDD